MIESTPFGGKVLCAAGLTLGEGPTYDVGRETTWWFDIKGKALHELHLPSGRKTVHGLPFMASALARIDGERQLIAAEDGLFVREVATGELSILAELEADKPGNRSNDGRMHQSGALWIGTMGKSGEDEAGAIYHVRGKSVTLLYPRVSIPNSICFSPDGATAYFTDSKAGKLMSVAVDPATGMPTAAPTVLVDGQGRDGDFDGSVCDADGFIWNARWGAGCVDRYDPAGRHVESYAVPAKQVTCPAFIGGGLDRLLVTSARDGLGDTATDGDGQTFDLGIAVKGRAEPDFRL
ncbi:SMP-30/gluconolactonase/LRE family protein [Ciceribacter sp. L1K23]|uniref:SMP-30/gluconolactonase/LRE family protein n=1 Tax=Ciceribacter sp. L1K23 TaxID=2820276 RepID=UPI001B82E880|nr:SMP-30/gluconolactonase/LRE family protein [Ciceribacter sp. L1K23]MBR0556799.1 SMP-30/gluconolactonase/LRE family protein [Ciceribacter sp. L1K23]